MSMQYCFFCDKSIDTDKDAEHFNDAGKCISPTVGIDYYGREFYVSQVPDYGPGIRPKCLYCKTPLNTGNTAIADEDKPFPSDWFCSYDCVNEKISEWDKAADAAIDREKVERRTGSHWTQRASDKAQLDKLK